MFATSALTASAPPWLKREVRNRIVSDASGQTPSRRLADVIGAARPRELLLHQGALGSRRRRRAGGRRLPVQSGQLGGEVQLRDRLPSLIGPTSFWIGITGRP